MYYILIILFSFNGHLCYFYFLTVVNNAIMNIHVQVLCERYVFHMSCTRGMFRPVGWVRTLLSTSL